VTKITKCWSATHNANSPLFLSFTFTLGQTDCDHQKFHFNSSCASRDILRTVEIGIWYFPYTNGYVERFAEFEKFKIYHGIACKLPS